MITVIISVILTSILWYCFTPKQKVIVNTVREIEYQLVDRFDNLIDIKDSDTFYYIEENFEVKRYKISDTDLIMGSVWTSDSKTWKVSKVFRIKRIFQTKEEAVEKKNELLLDRIND